ncbi:terminal uridylyltransferase 4 [Ascaphus truei]|uniref:terminal uridylyltransferase 4 n=1 Tax=Ascaphus truei TaxID=8439 RepID=UPI003F5A1770
MEDASKTTNNQSRKPARAGRAESKGVRVVSNQKHKHRGDSKPVRDGEGSSPVSSQKGKPSEPSAAVLGDLKTCRENSVNCTAKDLELDRQDQSHSKMKKSSRLPVGNSKPTRAEEQVPKSQGGQELAGKENVTAGLKETPENCAGTQNVDARTDLSPRPPESEQKSTVKAREMNKASVSPSLAEPVHVGTEDSALAEEELGLKQAEERLERDYIFRLEKRSPDFANCQYLCRLCSIHIENVQGAHKHIKEKRHKKNIMEKQEENELRNLPSPFPSQVAALSVALIDVAKEHGISEEDFRCRQEIVGDTEKIIQMKLPECSLRMYGSCLTGFAFKISDINIDIKFPLKMSQPDVLIQVLDILKNCAHYTDVESDFHAKVPVVFCKDKKSGLTCKVSAGNDTACLTTDLLAAVGKLEPAFIPLVLAFRYWARLCHIDCQEEGGIPSYSFALMVMFFLQRRKPPILPVYLGPSIEGFEFKKQDEYHLKGVSEERFLKWECKPASGSESKNSSGIDGRARAEQQRGNNRKSAGSEADNRKNKIKQGKCPLVFERPHQVSLGQLWLELLKFYTLEFAMEEHVISVRVQDLLTRENKNWPRRRIAIEDPFAIKRNVARSLNSQMVYEYILERFRMAYKYFACPQSKDRSKSKTDTRNGGKLIVPSASMSGEHVANGSLPETGNSEEAGEKGSGLTGGKTVECNGIECTSQSEVTNAIQRLAMDSDNADVSVCVLGEELSLAPKERIELDQNSVDEEEQAVEHFEGEDKICHSCNGNDGPGVQTLLDTTEGRCDVGTVCSLDNNCPGNCTLVTSLHHEASKDEGNLSEAELHYVFDVFILTSGKPPTIVCSICKRDGHSKDDCPEDFKKIDLKPLPPMSVRFRDILDKVCRRCYDELSPNVCEQQNREQILSYLERFIRKEFNDKARLCLFGSSKNGFGFRDSDLDICMTLEGHENAEKLNCREIIEGLAKVLKRHPGLKNILPITTAKVPIVKFEHRESGLEGDISLYNTLAQHNTRMLATYAAIDPRVKYLGYTIKFFAKRCDIGDASRGSLSSYAYILMVLYFLQQRNPPVIPVLQEIFDGLQIPQRMVDGWNAFFFDNKEDLRGRFPALGKNTETVGELWLGLLRFYTEQFDFKEHVISIRQKKLLTTFEKQWTSKCIAIEDPFDLNHNLGAGVSRKMTNFIMKAFINGRKLFGTPYYPLHGWEAEYFFDSKVLTDGELAPNDRCCRVCGKIGHYMKDCPKRRRLKKKENEKDDEKDVKEEERDPREKRCFTCGDVGHVRRDCTENKQVRQKNNNVLVSQLLRSMINPQPVLTPLQQQLEHPARTRQVSESSESHKSSYSPQPQPFPQNPTNPTQPPQTKLGQQQPTPAQNPHQVQRPMFTFPHSPPSHYSARHNLGLLPMHPQIPLPNSSWPIHGPVLRPSLGNPPHSGGVTFPVRPGGNPSTSNQSAVNLNDPSIIFAQPAVRSLGVPNSTHEGPWHNSLTPNALVSNGTVGNADQGFQGQFGKLTPPSTPWERRTPPHFPLLPASWPYNLPQNFLQQAPGGFHSKPFYPPAGSLIQNGPRFPVLSQGHPHLNTNFIQQKK